MPSSNLVPARGATSSPSTATIRALSVPVLTKKLVPLAMLMTRSRMAPPGETRTTSGSVSGRRLARRASYWTSLRSAPFIAIFVPPDADDPSRPIFMPAMEGAFRLPLSSARMAAGSRVVKSLSMTTASGSAGDESRMIRGAVIIGCSWSPKCECIQ
jgi:hypothetical protein